MPYKRALADLDRWIEPHLPNLCFGYPRLPLPREKSMDLRIFLLAKANHDCYNKRTQTHIAGTIPAGREEMKVSIQLGIIGFGYMGKWHYSLK